MSADPHPMADPAQESGLGASRLQKFWSVATWHRLLTKIYIKILVSNLLLVPPLYQS